MLESLDAAAIGRWCATGLAGLRRHQREIDQLNVYPVPDGDTGTNLVLTLTAADRALAERPDGTLGGTLDRLARGALLGARGNSGVILSQLLRGLADALAGLPAADGPALAGALDCAADAAYRAVAEPVEGTVLTVARAAAQAAGAAVADGAVAPGAATDRRVDLAAVTRVVSVAAREALARTPQQLPALARAGVVDAGGRGLVVLLDALVEVVTGARPAELPAAAPATPLVIHRETGSDEYAYEVQYLLDAEEPAVDRLRGELAALGDSLVIVGTPGVGGGLPTWNVHVHVNDVGAALEAGVCAGRPHRIAVTRFADQTGPAPISPAPISPAPISPATTRPAPIHPALIIPARATSAPTGPAASTGAAASTGPATPTAPVPLAVTGPAAITEPSDDSRLLIIGPARKVAGPVIMPGLASGPEAAEHGLTAVVVVAEGEALARLFAAEGCEVVSVHDGLAPSIGDVLTAIRSAGAARVVVLPNDPDMTAAVAAAAHEARAEGIRVGVVPTRSPVQAMAALAVRSPHRRFEDDVIAMAEAAGACRCAAVTTAAREALTVAGRCHPGDVLALVEGEVNLIGSELVTTSLGLLDRLLAGGGELVTLLLGDTAPDGLAEILRDHLASRWPFVEVQTYRGGQPHYPLLVGVE